MLCILQENAASDVLQANEAADRDLVLAAQQRGAEMILSQEDPSIWRYNVLLPALEPSVAQPRKIQDTMDQ